jgi:hypothetical protein
MGNIERSWTLEGIVLAYPSGATSDDVKVTGPSIERGERVEVVSLAQLQGAVSGLYACPQGHRSTVTRHPNPEGVRRCFFCGEVADPAGGQ